MLWARINHETVDAMAIRRGMEAVGFGPEILERRVFTLLLLNPPKRLHQRSASLIGLDQTCNRRRVLTETHFNFRLQFDPIEFFREAAVVILVALRDAPTIEPFRDDRVSDTQPEQLGILKMPETVRPKRERAVFVGLPVGAEDRRLRLAGKRICDHLAVNTPHSAVSRHIAQPIIS